ncbi:ABC transporter permease [Paenibacillus sp. P22]|uniref:ABC transporter permease n=1 Tax=Paenibacillus sp. P22 TaxID=483908 RepID=UPI00038F9B95|nr:ABC transporter permease [Paenibacillus sp. P22]CDN42776.1 Uncharacterized protein BN871_BX_00080 [Paenibacillus sp. P22]
MARLLASEWIKLRRSIIWLLLPASPLLAFVASWRSSLDSGGAQAWREVLAVGAMVHGYLFLPLLVGIFAALLCRFEHASGGWKQLLALPVRPAAVYGAKLAAIMALAAILQLLMCAAIAGAGLLRGLDAPVPWGMIGMSAFGGWLACLPLAALQLLASTAFQSFAAPLAVNVVFTIPNMLVANSRDFAPWYPWVQPLLAMVPQDTYGFGAFNVSLETLLAVIGGSFLVFLCSGLLYFVRRAV